MQIIAGTYRGRKLAGAATKAVRPCTGRVKKSIFDTLAARIDFEGIRVLDLFAGFGNLGFEALSRGAAHVTFVDRGREALAAMQRSAAQLGLAKECAILDADVESFVRRGSGAPWALVFCDPPYAWEDYPGLIEAIIASGALAEEAFLLIEHSTEHDFSDLPSYAFHRDYGMTRVTYFRP